MPDLTDRLTRESELDADLQIAFKKQKKRVLQAGFGSFIDWSEFQAKIGGAFRKHLGSTFGVASKNMLKQHTNSKEEELALLLFLIGQDDVWASGVSDILSSDTVVNSQREMQKARERARKAADGAETTADAVRRETNAWRDLIDTIFGKKRTEVISATETTRTVTKGEDAGRLIIETITGRRIVAIWMTEVQQFGTDPPIGPPPPYGVCPICLPLHRKEENEWPIEYRAGPPSPHPNCRCYLDYRVLSGPEYGR